MMCGGHSAFKTPEADDIEFFNLCKADIQAKAGKEFSVFEPHHFTTQVVAGTIFQVAIKVDDGSFIHAKIVRFLPHTGKAPEVMAVALDKAEGDQFAF